MTNFSFRNKRSKDSEVNQFLKIPLSLSETLEVENDEQPGVLTNFAFDGL